MLSSMDDGRNRVLLGVLLANFRLVEALVSKGLLSPNDVTTIRNELRECFNDRTTRGAHGAPDRDMQHIDLLFAKAYRQAKEQWVEPGASPDASSAS